MSASSLETAPPPAEEEAEAVERPHGLLRGGGTQNIRAKRWAVIVAASFVLVGAGYVFTRSPVFAAHRIEITGRSHLSRAAVLRLAGVQRGTNVFWLHTGSVDRRLEANRWIAMATVTRSLPATITIRIEERSPVGVVPNPSGGYDVVASDGTTLEWAKFPGTYPRLLVQPTTPGALAVAARVAGSMDPWLRSRVGAVDARTGTMVVRLRSGIPVYYGTAASAAAKDRALGAVLRWALQGAQPVQSIDVRAPLAPTAQLPYTPPAPVPVPSPSARHGKHPAGASPSPGASPSASPSPSSGLRSRHHSRRSGGTKR